MRPLAALTLLAAVHAPALLLAQGPSSPLDRRVDSVFSAFSRTGGPGCAVGVDQRGAPLIRRAYGMANLETGTPFSVSTISESGSTAKQFVAAALVMLARDGVLTLDDDVSRWVPEVKGFGARISVRQLLEPYQRNPGPVHVARRTGTRRRRCGSHQCRSDRHRVPDA